jgi:catechol 2,3-dioxygenase-like lactoylglutathione lyase family enzyme
VPIVGLDHVQVAAPAGCEPEARRFYGDLLGLPGVDKPEPMRARGGAWFQAGEQQLHVGVEEGFVPARKAHPAFVLDSWDAVDALAEALVAAGHEVRWDRSVPGTHRFHVDDPWGNRVEILGRPQ